jgi:transaldolase
VMVKLPTVAPGVKACRDLSRQGYAVHMTLCYQPMQALAAAKARAKLISLHVSQHPEDDEGAATFVRKSRRLKESFGHDAELMVCGMERPPQLLEMALAGADAAMVTFPLLEQMVSHPLTESAVRDMIARWCPPAAPRISA